MDRFVKIIIDRKNKKLKNTDYLPQIIELYCKFSKYLSDDFFLKKGEEIACIIDFVEKISPYFWVVLDENRKEVAGFVFLENIVGNSEKLHSAEITTCFYPKYWGEYTKKCAKKFIKYCFKKYRLNKLKALIFEQNFKVKALLKHVGFKREASLKSETIKGGKPQNIDIYSIIRRIKL